MFPGVGTLINVVAVAIGSTLGVITGSKLSNKAQSLITDVLGLITALGAVSALAPLWAIEFRSALPDSTALLVILASMLVGGLLGHALNLDVRLDSFGESLRRRFRASSDSPFVEGFVSASLLFVIGPLAILGSISDGAAQGIDQLILKSSLDFFASLAFASTLGWGVAASIIPVALYQGFWTLVGATLGQAMDLYQIEAMTICGGLMLIGISLRLLDIKKIPVANLLPALVVAPLFATFLHAFI